MSWGLSDLIYWFGGVGFEGLKDFQGLSVWFVGFTVPFQVQEFLKA